MTKYAYYNIPGLPYLKKGKYVITRGVSNDDDYIDAVARQICRLNKPLVKYIKYSREPLNHHVASCWLVGTYPCTFHMKDGRDLEAMVFTYAIII